MNSPLKQNTNSLFDPQEDAISAYMGSLLGVVPDNSNKAANLDDLNLTHKNPPSGKIRTRLDKIADSTNGIIQKTHIAKQSIDKSNNDKAIAIEVSDENGEKLVKYISPRIKEAPRIKQAPGAKQAPGFDEDKANQIETVSQQADHASKQKVLDKSGSQQHKLWVNKLDSELQKLATNKVRYRNLKHFLSASANEVEIEAVSRKKIIIENNQLKKNLFEQQQINQQLNEQVDTLTKDLKQLKQLEFSKLEISDNIPFWAVPSFQVMNISLNKLKVGVPFHSLHSVLSMEVTNLQAVQTKQGKNLLLGEFEFEGQTIKLLDLKSVIFPNDYQKINNHEEFSVVVIKDEQNDLLFALLCDSIEGLATANYQDFTWKNMASARKWLAATNRQDKCVVIDTQGLFNLINQVLS